MAESAPYCLQARWILPIAGAPLRDGLITLAGNRIVAVGENRSGRAPLDLGRVALLPGLVNAHTHLEFSQLTAPLAASDTSFTDWIRTVVEHRRQPQEPEAIRAQHMAAVQQGLAETHATGTALVGEIATPGWSADCFAESSAGGVIFLELLGLDPARADALCALAEAHVQRTDVSPAWQMGLSPHAPYTVGPELLERLVNISAAAKAPLAMHLAESFAELELLRSGSGPFEQLLTDLGAWYSAALPRGMAPLDYLELLARAHRALVIHGNFLSDEEIAFLAARAEHMSVVYCPRTHARFVGGENPLAEMLAAGVQLALGTDSRASNPDLSLWREMQYLHQRGVAPGETILQLGTLGGARALGKDAEFGSLLPGKQAAITVVALPFEESDDVYEETMNGQAFPLSASLRASLPLG